MSIHIQEFLKNEKLPKFLVDHKILNSIGKVSKIFPSIGLPNCQETCKFDNANIAKRSASDLIYYTIYPLCDKFYHATYRPIPDKTKYDNLMYWRDIAYKIKNSSLAGNFVIVNPLDNKVSLKLSSDIVDNNNKVIFKHGESLFRVYNKIYDVSRSLRLGVRIPKLDTIPQFKRFSTDNIPSKDYQIVFSSDNLDGLWDIATMSMRGIKSCQGWNGRFRAALVGSIIDPFVGIIYLTSGKDIDGFGSKMIKRCIVRYAVDNEAKKPIIVIDKMYPEFDEKAADLFTSFIKKKTENKIEVLTHPFNIDKQFARFGCGKLYIPNSKIQDKLSRRTKSYMDTPVPMQKEIPNKSILSININNRKLKLRNLLIQEATVNFPSIKNTNIAPLSKSDNIKASIRQIVDNPDTKYMIVEYYTKVIKRLDEDMTTNTAFNNSSDYNKKLCFAFLTGKHKRETTSFVRTLNNYYGFQKGSRINSDILNKILAPIQKSVSNAVKLHLKEQLANRSAGLTAESAVVKV